MMPKNVLRFERLMLLSFAIGTLSNVIKWQHGTLFPRYGLVTIILISLIVISIFFFFIWLISRRRQNWARWLCAGLFVVGLPLWIFHFPSNFRNDPTVAILSAAVFAAQLIACCLLFTGDAPRWFKRAHADPAAGSSAY